MKTKVLIGAIFVLMVGGFGREAVYEYQRDSMIQANPGAAVAKVVGHEIHTKSRRGRETTTYTIRYAFEADGKAYEDSVSLKNEVGAAALSIGAFEVAYSKADPTVHVLKSGYRDGRTLSGLLWVLFKLVVFALIAAPLAGLLLAWKFGWLKKREPAAQPSA